MAVMDATDTTDEMVEMVEMARMDLRAHADPRDQRDFQEAGENVVGAEKAACWGIGVIGVRREIEATGAPRGIEEKGVREEIEEIVESQALLEIKVPVGTKGSKDSKDLKDLVENEGLQEGIILLPQLFLFLKGEAKLLSLITMHEENEWTFHRILQCVAANEAES
jgi:hypothetical protein